MSKTTNKKTVYYDDTCNMCSAIIGKIGSPQNDGVYLCPLTSAPEGVDRERLKKEIHVIDENGNQYANVDALVQILDEYPKLRFLGRLLKLPGINQVARLVYKWVAANRHFLFGPTSRVFWLKAVVIFGMVSGVLFSLSLWAGDRSYPTVPVIPGLPAVEGLASYVLLAGLLLSLGLALLVPKPKPYLWTSIGLTGLLVLFDQSRLQPWVYQYGFLLATLALFSWKSSDNGGARISLNIARIIIASVYFWSGVQKMNSSFIDGTFPWIIQPIAELLPGPLAELAYSSGVLVPFIEAGAGIALLFNRTRVFAFLTLIAMCATILFVLGPFGHNWNSVIWPWNITMILCLLILFAGTKDGTVRQLFSGPWPHFQKLVAGLFILMPAFSLVDKWDSYLSASLYSGNIKGGYMELPPESLGKLPPQVRRYVYTVDGKNYLMIGNWSYGETNTPAYPEARVYRAIGRNVCQTIQNSDSAVLFVSSKTGLTGNTQAQSYRCPEL